MTTIQPRPRGTLLPLHPQLAAYEVGLAAARAAKNDAARLGLLRGVLAEHAHLTGGEVAGKPPGARRDDGRW